jgi:hypothetical protein
MSVWILAILLLGGGLIGIEARRSDRKRRVLRIAAIGVATLALAGLVLLAGPTPASYERLTIVTPGAREPSRPRGVIRVGDTGDPRSLATLGAAGDELRHARSLTVLGWGFLPDELPPFALPKIVHRAPALPRGVTALDAPTIVMRGRVELATGDSAWVVLEDPGGPRDSMRVGADEPWFAVSDRPRAAGAVDYRLRVTGAGWERIDTAGVWVAGRRPPSVLILEGSPSFETGFLKRWLSGRGGAVGIRTTVSRDRYRTETLNGAAPPAALNERLLKAYDLIVADAEALKSISAEEREALMRSVRDGGGFLLAGAADRYLAGTKGEGFCGFATVARGSGETRLVRPTWSEAPRPGRTAIRAGPVVLAKRAGTALVKDGQGDVLAAMKRLGDGAVAVTVLEAPSRWVLEGDDELFAGYWAALIGAVARDTAARFRIEGVAPVLPDHRLGLELRARTVGGPIVVIAPSGLSDTVALAQDPLDPARWTGLYWPRQPGWHRVAGADAGFKVQQAGAWTGVEAATRLATMSRLSAARAGAAAGIPSSWLRLWCWTALIVAMTIVWAEDRRRRDGS